MGIKTKQSKIPQLKLWSALRNLIAGVMSAFRLPRGARVRSRGVHGSVVSTVLGLVFRRRSIRTRIGRRWLTPGDASMRMSSVFMILVLVSGLVFEVFSTHLEAASYKISGSASSLLKDSQPLYASKLQFNEQTQSYEYNIEYQAAGASGISSSGPKFKAQFPIDPKLGSKIIDPRNDSYVTFKPKFKLSEPIKDDNRLIYPIPSMDAIKVETLGASLMKEDIILNSFISDEVVFEYEIEVPDGLEARLEPNGSLAIYGVAGILLGNVTTGTEQDAELLKKARKNSEKTELLFEVPAPFVVETNKQQSQARSWYTLEGSSFKVHATGLKDANYPLSIDPTIFVESARELMRGNNESNIDFDIDNQLIQKSQTTGARINAWSSTSNLTNAVWAQGNAVAGGYIYSTGGAGSGIPTTQTWSTAGVDTFVVPVGVTSLTIKTWGAGGGGGAGSGGSGRGGHGGGGGYSKGVVTVAGGDSLDIRVGSGGAKATANSGGGNGGGYTWVRNTTSGTTLMQAGGGGGGGGSGGTGNGRNGGAGGGSSGAAGQTGGTASSGGGGTTSGGAGGTAGTGGVAGAAGAADAGGNPGGTGATCATSVTGSTGGNGGTGAGGGGTKAATCTTGGGGGGGEFGGGGGGSAATSGNRTAGGGGGGSSLATGTSQVETAGSGQTPGNNGDSDRGGMADGGTGATTAASATAGDAGQVVISYVAPGPATAAVYWAEFASDNSISSPNPGTGACTGWCTNSAYDMPASRYGHSLVAYNGFLYVIGGFATGGAPQTSVYIAKLGANGEPQLWHPSGGTPAYWYTDTSLSNARANFSAVAYNNRMYLLGGLTTSSTVLSTNTVQYADINPMGTLSAFTTTGMQALSTARHSLTAHIYNDVLYVLGGNASVGGSTVSTVEYSKLNSNGTMNPWVTTASLTGGRQTSGGSFSTLYGGYLYVSGGCSVVNASGYCTTIATDVQLASVNADGSLTAFTAIAGLTNDRFAHTLIAWQGGLYRLGGCRAQSATTGSCDNLVLDVDYGVINPDGEASTVATSAASGVAPCSGGNPYNCDMPSSIGNMLNATVVLNGYIYIMGGCATNACTSGYSSGVTYQAIGSDGSLQKPASCDGTYTDAYCVSSDTLPASRAAPGVAIFNNRIYLVGGFPSRNDISHIGVNPDGSLTSWTTHTFANLDVVNELSYTFAYARANPNSASTYPGNLYIFGGCGGSAVDIGCQTSGYVQRVYKCNIETTGDMEEDNANDCTLSGQTQIGTVGGATGTGLGAHAGAVYANYIYLMGGLAPGITDLTTVRYAKFDDSNNVVPVSGSGWVEGTEEMNTGRRRGTGFGYNGFLYVMGGYDGNDAIADIEFAKINVSDGSWGIFDTSSVTIQKRWGLSSAVSNSYAYVVGGCTAGAAPTSCSTRTSTIQTFQVYNNESGAVHNINAASDDTFAASTDRWGASAAVLNGYIYVAGGCISATDCTDATNDVQYAPISATDGSVGTWASATNALPADRAWGQLEVAGGNLYYLGGQDDTATNEQSTVYYVGTFTTGNITAAWSTASGGIGDTASQAAQERTKFGAAVWDDRIYVVGGLNGSAADTNTVYVSPKLPTGGNIAADSWTESAILPDVARYGGTLVAYANNLYYFGGNDGTNFLNDAQFSSLGYKTGTISQSGTTVTGVGTSWTSSMQGSTLKYGDGSSAVIDTVTSATSMTTIGPRNVPVGSLYVILDGSVGNWTFSTSTPGYVSEAEGFAANGYLYLVGGRRATSSCAPKTLFAPISANTNVNQSYYSTGTITQTGTAVTGALTEFSRIYVGGTMYYADGSTATITAINSETSLTVGTSKTITSGESYQIASGVTLNNGTGVGEWSETNVRFAGGRYGAAVAYDEGKMYVMGGGCSSPQAGSYSTGTITQATNVVTGAGGATFTDNLIGATITYADASTATVVSVNSTTTLTVSVSKTIGSAQSYSIAMPRHSYSTLKSQPQVAIYSRMIDTDTDVFPNSWLMNGIDNSIGARWQVRYRSMNDIDGIPADCGSADMSTWGQETNFGTAIMGDVADYIPKNGSGTNINCARYFYFYAEIDAEQTFGYPEDVNRGPTMSDLSLFFTSDPSKRLRHGKTFTGGEQQPLDTPCGVATDADCPGP